jgi:hypothetical protein
MRKLLLAGAAIGALMVSWGAAQADFIFSGSGLNGFLNPPAGEGWTYRMMGTTDISWSSPGLGFGLALIRVHNRQWISRSHSLARSTLHRSR